jgi:hypothetical protein
MTLLSRWPIQQPPLVFDHTQACAIARPKAVAITLVCPIIGADRVPFAALSPLAYTAPRHDNLICPCREVLAPPLAGAE